MTTENQYYYLERGEVVGPLSAVYIRGLLRTGKLTSETEVCVDGSQDWQPLYQYEELCVSPSQIKPTLEKQDVTQSNFESAELTSASRQHSMPEPGIASVIRVLAFIVAAGGIVGCFAAGTEGSTSLAILSLFAAGAWAVFVYSWSAALTWIYNIMLNTRNNESKDK